MTNGPHTLGNVYNPPSVVNVHIYICTYFMYRVYCVGMSVSALGSHYWLVRMWFVG